MDARELAHFIGNVDAVRSISEDAHQRHNPVISAGANLRAMIEAFEAQLDADHEVALRLASFGGVIMFHAETIGFPKPDLVTFTGISEDGEQVQLIQHVTQLSVLLRAAKKQLPEARRIAFV